MSNPLHERHRAQYRPHPEEARSAVSKGEEARSAVSKGEEARSAVSKGEEARSAVSKGDERRRRVSKGEQAGIIFRLRHYRIKHDKSSVKVAF